MCNQLVDCKHYWRILHHQYVSKCSIYSLLTPFKAKIKISLFFLVLVILKAMNIKFCDGIYTSILCVYILNSCDCKIWVTCVDKNEHKAKNIINIFRKIS